MQNKIPRLSMKLCLSGDILRATTRGPDTGFKMSSPADPRVVTIYICCKNNFKVGKFVLTTWCFPVRPKCRLWHRNASVPYDATLHHTHHDASVWLSRTRYCHTKHHEWNLTPRKRSTTSKYGNIVMSLHLQQYQVAVASYVCIFLLSTWKSG